MQLTNSQHGSKGQQGTSRVALRYVVQPSDLGWTLIAASDRGICTIQFNDHPETAIAQLNLRFPSASFLATDSEFNRWVATVLTFIEAPQRDFNLPLDLRGTAFQQTVWHTLRTIPPGQTVSYTEVAQQLGNPKAVRAVARACASNDIAVVIPCHRVVGSNGSLTGYRWGLERKQALLAREAMQQAQSAVQPKQADPALSITAGG